MFKLQLGGKNNLSTTLNHTNRTNGTFNLIRLRRFYIYIVLLKSILNTTKKNMIYFKHTDIHIIFDKVMMIYYYVLLNFNTL